MSVRLFVGLAIEESVAQRLAGIAVGLPGARRVEARNLHLTLRFVGEVEETLGRDLHDALEQIRAPAFPLVLEGLGSFGGGRPHTLWVGVERNPDLAFLRDRIETACLRLGLAAERKFTPHVTLARLKQTPASRLGALIAGSSPLREGPLAVEAFTLFRSHLGHGGAEYEALAAYPLGS